MLKKILIILPGNLGDVIMALPVLQGLKAKYAGCHIFFFVESGFEAGLLHCPYCDEIMAFSRKEIRNRLNSSQWMDGAGQLKAAVRQIREGRFDEIMNLCQHTYISYIASLAQGAVTLGQCFLREGNHAIGDPWSVYLYAIPFSRMSNALHAADVYRRIAGVSMHCGSYGLCVAEEERRWAREFLIGKGIDPEKKIMALQAGAAFPSKMWPVEHYVALANLLVEQGWQILLTGAPQEAPIVESIYRGIRASCAPCAGETSFRQSIALCSFARGCVTGDTAHMHAAAGLGVPVYSLFGATNPTETGPYGNGHWVFSAHCPDRPCFKDTCATGICMRSILPQTVFKCIMENSPGNHPRCDVYRTALAPNGDFRLIPVTPDTFSYFNEAQAALARIAFGDPIAGKNLSDTEFKIAVGESRKWVAIVEKMVTDLVEFPEKKDTVLIKAFESHKATLVACKGIGAFWTAVLNLRLNSLPLLNPLEGVEQSRRVCTELVRQIGRAVNTSSEDTSGLPFI